VYAAHNSMYSLEDLHCVQLYDFGITYDIPGLCNSALAALAARNENLSCTTALSAVQLAFELRPRASQLRRYLIAEATRQLESKNVRSCLVDFPKVFVHKVLQEDLEGQQDQEHEVEDIEGGLGLDDAGFLHSGKQFTQCTAVGSIYAF
ncbi:hypothetical protein LTR56_005455, partial [Elasticomyces elasticus]